MSYMDTKNILSEGFFDSILTNLKKLTHASILKLHPGYRKEIKKGMKAAKEAEAIFAKLNKQVKKK